MTVKIREDDDIDSLMPNYPKDTAAFESGEGICYIPEAGGIGYTRKDFLNLVRGDLNLARKLFDMTTWEHPETILDQDEDGNAEDRVWPFPEVEFPIDLCVDARAMGIRDKLQHHDEQDDSGQVAFVFLGSDSEADSPSGKAIYQSYLQGWNEA